MTQDEAGVIAKRVWGPSGYASTLRRRTGNEAIGQRPQGAVILYSVGYRRKGKKNNPTTVKGMSGLSFADAFRHALRNSRGKERQKLEALSAQFAPDRQRPFDLGA